MECLINRQTNYTVRHEQFNGRRHVVVPVVMMVEGVHSGSGGPTFYTAEELSKFAAAWNGRPVPVDHPVDANGNPVSCNEPHIIERNVLGHVYNTYWDSGKLRAELWLDEAKTQQTAPRIASALRSGSVVEVSTGLFSDNIPTQGEFNGTYYEQIAQHIRPDHLALLPDTRGACSVEDGCGVRANSGKEVMEDLTEQIDKKNVKEKVKEFIDNLKEKYGPYVNLFVTQEAGFREISAKIQSKLDAMDDEMTVYYFMEAYDDYFIYRVRNREQGTDKLYKRGYTMNESGEVDFGSERTEVAEKREYVPVQTQQAANQSTTGEEAGQRTSNTPETNKESEVIGMEKVKELSRKLIDNKKTKFEEADREWLEAQSESVLNKLVPEEEEGETVEANAQQTQEPKQVSFEELLANAPREYQEHFQQGIQAYKEQQEELVTVILANSKDWTDEELRAKSISELKKIAGIIRQAPTAPMYIGNGPGRQPEGNKRESGMGFPTANGEYFDLNKPATENKQ